MPYLQQDQRHGRCNVSVNPRTCQTLRQSLTCFAPWPWSWCAIKHGIRAGSPDLAYELCHTKRRTNADELAHIT